MGISFGVFFIYFVGILVAPYSPNKIKNEHFECGLPPSSSQPKKANFGFFMFAIMFIVADMTGLFFTLFVYASSLHSQIIAIVFALIMAVAIGIAMKEFGYVENI